MVDTLEAFSFSHCPRVTRFKKLLSHAQKRRRIVRGHFETVKKGVLDADGLPVFLEAEAESDIRSIKVQDCL